MLAVAGSAKNAKLNSSSGGRPSQYSSLATASRPVPLVKLVSLNGPVPSTSLAKLTVPNDSLGTMRIGCGFTRNSTRSVEFTSTVKSSTASADTHCEGVMTGRPAVDSISVGSHRAAIE